MTIASYYFPEAPPTLKAVTIRHLLTHTSGIPDVYDSSDDTQFTKGIVDSTATTPKLNSRAHIWHNRWNFNRAPSGATAMQATNYLVS